MKALFAKCLGPGRFARTAYRLREQVKTEEYLGVNVFKDDKLIGTVSLTALNIGGSDSACLLGPLLIDEDYRSKGLGLELIDDAIKLAKDKGFQVVLLVGDLSYYEKAGFKHMPPGQIHFPGPVDPARILAYEIESDALANLKGQVSALEFSG
mgnify:CR=1 FL=1